MGYALRPGLHYCSIGDQLIFLDLVADRYFSLGNDAALAFSRLTDTESGRGPDKSVADLVASGLIERRQGGSITVCPAIDIPHASALDSFDARPSKTQRIRALLAVRTMRTELKLQGFGTTIADLALLKEGARLEPARSRILVSEAAAFDWTARWLPSHDQCLSRSLAIARRLVTLGIAAELIIGVRLRPFAAHCWAQTKEMIVNDRFEQVRSYRPILVV